MTDTPMALIAAEAPPRLSPSLYPAPFAAMVQGRVKHPLGQLFGLRNFGVNLVRLAPGGMSALMHRHSRQDEFVFVLEGEVVLVADDGEAVLRAGACAGFPAGGRAHQLLNRGLAEAVYLEVGDRTPDDRVEYPNDDLIATGDAGSGWRFTRRDGSDY